MSRPPAGLALPVRLVQVTDGDTIVVAGRRGNWQVSIRLLDCWAPELSSEQGRRAKAHVEQQIERHGDLLLHVPLAEEPDDFDPIRLLGGTTLGRVLGRVYAGSIDLGADLVAHGYATTTKPK